MGDYNIYGNASEEGRHAVEKSGKELGEPIEEEEGKDDKTREDRRRRRDVRRGECGCRRVRRERGRTRKIISQNPFIIFFLEMYYKTPEKHVTEVAREAGKAWCALSLEERKKYILLAERERKRRGKLRTTWEERKDKGVC